jgi:hypothetical protein
MEPLPKQITPLVLEDLRQAAQYLEELADAPNTLGRDALLARRYAAKLWSASQAVERFFRERQR